MNLLNKQIQDPQFKLRMYVDKIEGIMPIYLFVFHVFLENNIIINIHLNPKEKAFRNFCNQCMQIPMQAVHFYNIDNQSISSAFVELDDDKDWYIRNLEISKEMRSNSLFSSLMNYVIKVNPNENTFNFEQNKKIKFAGF